MRLLVRMEVTRADNESVRPQGEIFQEKFSVTAEILPSAIWHLGKTDIYFGWM